jgi:5-hydroxyisourate hydrolase-like protein (transthyretin family)
MSTCDYTFETGRQYLVYARKTDDGRWTTSMCSGTKPLEESADDLEYVAGISRAPLTGRVYGSIERIVVDPADATQTTAVPAAGIQVELTRGSDRLTVSTDSQGRLDVQVPPGDYTIAPIVPQTIRVYGAPFETPVAARGCAPVQFGVISNGRIEGRVVEQDGSPVRNAQVDAVPSHLPPGQRPDGMTSPSGTTDDKGEFQIEAVLPGQYVVAVNARFGPRLTSPYATTYLPGVGRDQAEVIDIGDGERKIGLTIMVAPIGAATISGVVMFGDKPAAEADVNAALVEHRGNSISWTKTDRDGRFTLPVLKGMTYRITAGVLDGNIYRRVETVVAAGEQNDDISLSIPR